MQSYSISRRYSEFVDLNDQIIQTIGIPPPAPLPPKSYLRSPNTEERRAALESWLKALLEHKALRSCAALKQFLEVPLPKTARKVSDFYELIKDVRADLQLASRHLQSQTPDSHMQVKKALSSAEKTFTELAALETEQDISDAEKRRRRDVCDELHRKSLDLAKLAQNYRSSTQGYSQHSSSKSEKNESPFGPRSSGGRQLGPSQETTATLGKTNEELLQGQTQIIRQQDDLLSSLLPVLQRQKELGNIIGQELDEQNKLLDDIGDSMDTVEAKIKRGKKQITKITGKK